MLEEIKSEYYIFWFYFLIKIGHLWKNIFISFSFLFYHKHLHILLVKKQIFKISFFYISQAWVSRKYLQVSATNTCKLEANFLEERSSNLQTSGKFYLYFYRPRKLPLSTSVLIALMSAQLNIAHTSPKLNSIISWFYCFQIFLLKFTEVYLTSLALLLMIHII